MWHTYIDWTTEERPRAFYVGKGNEKRVKTLRRRNPRHTAIRKAYGINRVVVLTTDNEQIAFDEEIRLIAELKTRHDIEGHWGANFTDGGEGPSGKTCSLEQRQKISLALRGKSKKRKESISPEARENQRLGQMRRWTQAARFSAGQKQRKFTSEQIEVSLQRYQEGEALDSIARDFNITVTHVMRRLREIIGTPESGWNWSLKTRRNLRSKTRKKKSS